MVICRGWEIEWGDLEERMVKKMKMAVVVGGEAIG